MVLDKSPLTVTIEIRHFQQPVETMTHIFNKSTTNLGECIDTSDTFVGLYSTGMFSVESKQRFKYICHRNIFPQKSNKTTNKTNKMITSLDKMRFDNDPNHYI